MKLLQKLSELKKRKQKKRKKKKRKKKERKEKKGTEKENKGKKNVNRFQNILFVPPLLSQLNLCHALLPYLFQIRFNINISFPRKSSQRSSPLSLSVQNSVYVCLPSNICCVAACSVRTQKPPKVKNLVFLQVTPSPLVKTYRRSEGSWYPLLLSSWTASPWR